MRSLLTVAALVAVAFGTADEDTVPAEFLNRKISAEAEALTGQALVDYINAQNGPFKAKLNRRFAGMSPEKKRQHINGLSLSLEQIAAKTQNHLAASRHLELDVPDSFDSRTAWPNCPSIGYIRDQSDCGSCWAFGAAEAISDRICIASKGAQTVEVSADDILACCGYSCGFGCNGGDPIEAFRFWVKHGVVSGGNYGDSSTCLPYPFPPCEHHTNATHYKPCPEDMYPTPKCTKKCQDGYNTPYTQDKHYGKSAYGVSRRVADIQKEIMTNGPLEAAFSVYEDFEHYYGGIYTHTAGGYLGGHAVRVLGWGKEGNTPYWLVANSWNEDWGEKGYFRIVRGINDCGFESAMVGGLPKV